MSEKGMSYLQGATLELSPLPTRPALTIFKGAGRVPLAGREDGRQFIVTPC